MKHDRISNTLFYKVSIILIVSIIIIGSTLEYFINQQEIEEHQKQIVKSNKPLMNVINQRLQRIPQTQWQQEISYIKLASKLPISLFEITELSGDKSILVDLSKGNVISLYGKDDAPSLYLKINNSSLVLELETQTEPIIQRGRWIPLLFYLLIILVIYLLSSPFTKQLLKLRKAAQKIGEGDFSIRLTMTQSSTLYPIAEAFDNMAGKIETLMLRQRDLTNAVSHELRTPLARLKFAFEALESQSQDKELIKNINEMRDDVRELEKLVDEMLLYAQVNQIKKFERKKIKIIELIHNLVVNTNSGKIEIIKNIDAKINSQTAIFADERLLLRALSNILRNSISFSKHQCRLEVLIIKENLVIKILDDGPGIDSKIINRIFEPFVKIDSVNRKSGYGLGLAIAKNIINKHKGNINVANIKQQACFTIVLPMNCDYI